MTNMATAAPPHTTTARYRRSSRCAACHISARPHGIPTKTAGCENQTDAHARMPHGRSDADDGSDEDAADAAPDRDSTDTVAKIRTIAIVASQPYCFNSAL